ncbi:MAG TPA: hypothetical protein VNQ76_15060 [Planctomicrobium sp.]|nr:hypothetical protein [Planctomicrobium sp.]
MIGEELNEDARECLAGFHWNPTEFKVQVTPPNGPGKDDALIRFPSPVADQNEIFATVTLEWYQAKNENGELIQAPAVVVVHESGRKMPIGKMIAEGFRQRGVHAFLIHLPGYGERRAARPNDIAELSVRLRQGIVDTRRARDAVAALPCVTKDRIALQGTSLGGFVSSTTAGLDQGFHSVFILLSGGDIYGVVKNGEREAKAIRDTALTSGMTDDELREVAWSIEPTRLAHRLNPERTWLYSGLFDQVVPITNARLFAKAAKLSRSHHIQMPADHYTGILLLPGILDQMSAEILGIPVSQVKSPLQEIVKQVDMGDPEEEAPVGSR